MDDANDGAGVGQLNARFGHIADEIGDLKEWRAKVDGYFGLATVSGDEVDNKSGQASGEVVLTAKVIQVDV